LLFFCEKLPLDHLLHRPFRNIKKSDFIWFTKLSIYLFAIFVNKIWRFSFFARIAFNLDHASPNLVAAKTSINILLFYS